MDPGGTTCDTRDATPTRSNRPPTRPATKLAVPFNKSDWRGVCPSVTHQVFYNPTENASTLTPHEKHQSPSARWHRDPGPKRLGLTASQQGQLLQLTCNTRDLATWSILSTPRRQRSTRRVRRRSQ